jgi:putative phage-type endonuclease
MVEMITLKNREEWLKKRTSYIGGSDAASIVGMSPYKTNIDLWELKTGRREAEDISDKPYVKYGTVAETFLRKLFMLDFPQYKVEYINNNLWLNNKYPFAHASLDGWLIDEKGRRGILEIKTTNILQSMQKEKWKDRIPDNYYIQILHYLMVTEFDFAILKAQLKYEFKDNIMLNTRHYYIDREDVEEDIKLLENSEKEFYEYIKEDRQPPLILPNI